MFYVYLLKDPRTGEPFYAGKGQGDRAWHHQREVVNGTAKSNPSKIKRIQQILDDGLQVEVSIVAEYAYEEDALDHEFHLIEATQGLTNVAPGGEPRNKIGLCAARLRRLQELLSQLVSLKNSKFPKRHLIRGEPIGLRAFEKLKAAGKTSPQDDEKMAAFLESLPPSQALMRRYYRICERIARVKLAVVSAEEELVSLRRSERRTRFEVSECAQAS